MANRDDRLEEVLSDLHKLIYEHNSLLHELKIISKQNSDLLKKHDESLDELVILTSKNTNDLKYHIKRTDILQNRQHITMLLLSAGIGALFIKFGPGILDILKFLL